MPNESTQSAPDDSGFSRAKMIDRARPFSIESYQPTEKSRRFRLIFDKPRVARDTSGSQVIFSLPAETSAFGLRGGRFFAIAMVILLVLGVGRFIVWRIQDPFPGVSQCHQIELWMHGVYSDSSRIQWAVEDAKNGVSNEAEAKEANARLDQMFEDFRSSLETTPAPQEVAELRLRWIRVIDLILELSKADQKGDGEAVKSLTRDRDMAIVERMEEQKRVLGDCHLQYSEPA